MVVEVTAIDVVGGALVLDGSAPVAVEVVSTVPARVLVADSSLEQAATMMHKATRVAMVGFRACMGTAFCLG